MTLGKAASGIVTVYGGTFRIGFGGGDETEFSASNLKELEQLWRAFCEENGLKKGCVDYVEASMDTFGGKRGKVNSQVSPVQARREVCGSEWVGHGQPAFRLLPKEDGKMEEKTITYIAARHIRPHPGNPRKDLGDLSELAESIRKNGILQNLTVIPVDGEPGEYMALIGHRRYAAGIEAGVEEFPCLIAEGLTPREQMSVMLEENMQRSDLTVWEQANGFQMMLDLGETEESIAEKTGFSRTTVRHRLNIAKLNQEVLQEKERDEGFQMSLKDLYELERIPDIRTRDRILRESTSSNNLAQKAKAAADEIKRREREKAYIELCRAEGIKPAPEGAESEQYSGKWEKVKEFDLDKDVKDRLGCTQAAKEELFYVVWWRTFAVIRKKGREKRQLSEHELLQKEKDRRKRQVRALQKEMDAERLDFIRLAIEKKFRPGEEKPEEVAERLLSLMADCEAWMGKSTMVKFLTGETSLYGKTDEEKAAYEKQRASIGFLYKLLIYAASAVGGKDLAEWNAGYHRGNGELAMRLDEILSLFGFSYSREELYRLAEGTHELFREG